MKDETKPSFWSRTRAVSALSAGLIAAAMLGCGGDNNNGDDDKRPPKENVVLAMSGGGYHALAGAAAWMMGMMERTGIPTMDYVTENVDAIGSNSGGTWFLTLATYSPTFLAEIEKPGAYKNFAGGTGYMNTVWSYIKNETGGCKHYPDRAKIACEALWGAFVAAGKRGFANFLVSGGGQWQTVIDNSVFGKAPGWDYYEEASSQTLGSTRDNWSSELTLVLAGTLLTDSPSLTYTGRHIVDGFTGVQANQGYQGFYPKAHVPGGVPIMLRAPQAGDDPLGIDLLPGGVTTMKYGTWVEGFRSGAEDDEFVLKSADFVEAVNALPVINAAAISSAAGGGYIDIEVMKHIPLLKVDARQYATDLNGFAPGYQLWDAEKGAATMQFHANMHDDFLGTSTRPEQLTSTMAKNAIVRMADGGFFDNTAVAQMLRYLQEKNGGTVPNGFTIVAFDDFPGAQPVSGNDVFPTGGDVAALFGFNDCKKKGGCTMQSKEKGIHEESLLGLKYNGASMWVFPSSEYFSSGTTPLTITLFWEAEGHERVLCGTEKASEQALTYSRFSVSVDPTLPGSKALGLAVEEGGSSGTLHVFASLGGTAAVVPGNKDEFDCYNTMVTGIAENVIAMGENCDTTMKRSPTNDCTIGDYLQQALGL